MLTLIDEAVDTLVDLAPLAVAFTGIVAGSFVVAFFIVGLSALVVSIGR